MDRILEVHEKRPVLRLEHVPRVRLAVQDLLGRAPADNRLAQVSQRAGEKRPVGLGEIGSDVTARNVLLVAAMRSMKCGVGTSICRRPT